MSKVFMWVKILPIMFAILFFCIKNKINADVTFIDNSGNSYTITNEIAVISQTICAMLEDTHHVNAHVNLRYISIEEFRRFIFPFMRDFTRNRNPYLWATILDALSLEAVARCLYEADYLNMPQVQILIVDYILYKLDTWGINDFQQAVKLLFGSNQFFNETIQERFSLSELRKFGCISSLYRELYNLHIWDDAIVEFIFCNKRLLAFSKNGSVAEIYQKDYGCWQLEPHSALQIYMQEHEINPYCVSVSPDNRKILLGGEETEGVFYLLQVKEDGTLEGHHFLKDYVIKCCDSLDEKGEYWAFGCNKTIKIVRFINDLDQVINTVNTLDFLESLTACSINGQKILISIERLLDVGRIILWRITDRYSLERLGEISGIFRDCKVHENKIFSWSRDTVYQIILSSEGARALPLYTLAFVDGMAPIYDIAIDDAKLIVATGRNVLILERCTQTKKYYEIDRLEHQNVACCVTLCQNTILTLDAAGKLHIWEPGLHGVNNTWPTECNVFLYVLTKIAARGFAYGDIFTHDELCSWISLFDEWTQQQLWGGVQHGRCSVM